MATILSTSGVSKRFGDLDALNGVSLEIREGEFFTVVGPSGSGKSTFLRILAGLEAPDAGRVRLRGEDITEVPANRRPTCMVFQNLALFSHRTVGENIEFSLKMKRVAQRERRERALETMRIVRLPESYYSRRVTQCSGGERQRVALARALASDPEILFFDEPLSSIDYRLRKILEVEMKDLHRRTRKTFVYITHSLEEAMVMSDRVAILNEGRVVQTGTPAEIYYRPANCFVAEFMGEVNVFELNDGKIVELEVPAPGTLSGYLVVRPEFLRKLDAGEVADVRFAATVANDYMLGSRTHYHLRVGEVALVAEVSAGQSATLCPGDRADWGFDLADSALLTE